MAKNKKEHEFVWPEFKNDKETYYSVYFALYHICDFQLCFK